jgi:hypothetical protein
LEQVCGKAEAFIGAIRSLLPNVNGPAGLVRKLYYWVCESVVLYAALILASALSFEKTRILKRAQRAALIRTSTAYRTVSYAALCVVTGSMPINKAEGEGIRV